MTSVSVVEVNNCYDYELVIDNIRNHTLYVVGGTLSKLVLKDTEATYRIPYNDGVFIHTNFNKKWQVWVKFTDKGYIEKDICEAKHLHSFSTYAPYEVKFQDTFDDILFEKFNELFF